MLSIVPLQTYLAQRRTPFLSHSEERCYLTTLATAPQAKRDHSRS